MATEREREKREREYQETWGIHAVFCGLGWEKHCYGSTMYNVEDVDIFVDPFACGLLTNHCSGKAAPEEEKVVKRTSDCGTWP